MLAFRLLADGSTALREIERPKPRAGEVLVKVGAAGACHSDLHIMDAPAGFPAPVTLGHESAGYVEELGAGVDGMKRGDAVAIYGIVSCGYCRACLRGEDNRCRKSMPGGIGLSRDGGMAEYVSVPARQLLPIGDLDVTQAAPLVDAGLTPYHAINGCRDLLTPGALCVVIGVGGLGHMALQILAATTAATVVAVDSRPAALELARSLGARHAFLPQAAAAGIRGLVGAYPDGADVVLDFVGADATLEIARTVIATGGRISIVGLAGGALRVVPGVMSTIPLEANVVIPFWGTRAELAEVLALAQSKKIAAHIEKFPLKDAPRAYELLRAGKLQGRAVIVP